MCDWNTIWTAVSAIGTCTGSVFTAGTLFALIWPKYKFWSEKKDIETRIEHFFQNEEINFEVTSDSQECKNIQVKDYYHVNDEHKIVFYKFQKICLINNRNIYINSINFSCGYYTYKVISKNCIRIDNIDHDKGYIQHAFINKVNNLSKAGDNYQFFNTVVSW